MGEGTPRYVTGAVRFFSVTLVAPDFAIPCSYAIGELLGKIVNTF